MKYLMIVIVAFALSACNEEASIVGTYVNSVNSEVIRFESDGNVVVVGSHGKQIDKFKYTIAGNSVKTPGRMLSLSINDDGSLYDAVSYSTFLKQKDGFIPSESVKLDTTPKTHKPFDFYKKEQKE